MGTRPGRRRTSGDGTARKLVKRYRHDEINSAFDDSKSGTTVKPVVVH